MAAGEGGSPQDRITRFWSTVAPEYEAHGGNVAAPGSAEYGAWVDAIRDLLPPAPADILDIATGTGFVALIAAKLGHRVTGIDLAAPMLAEARTAAERQGLAIIFESRDAVTPGFAPGTFDAVICRHFLWTLREPETALRNWRDLLRPGGRVTAIDGFWATAPTDDEPETESPGLFEQHYTRDTVSALPVMRMREPAEVAELFRAAGFSNVAIGSLSDVHALAEDPPGEEPWYTITAIRG